MDPWQTRSADFHPYMIDGVDALPPKLREATEAALPPGEQVQRGFFVPADYRSPDGIAPSRVVPAQALIFTGGGLLHVQAPTLGAEDLLPPVFVQPAHLLWLRTSHLLLHGGMELLSAERGEAVTLALEFNAVGWRLMQAEWHRVVADAIGVTLPTPEEKEEEGHTFADQDLSLLAAAPDKFVDGLGRYGLYTGEKLLGAVYQPAVWKQNLITFDEQLIPNTLVALTAASVLILTEESALVRKSEQFGLIITRLPRTAVTAVTAAAAEEPLQALTFSLAREGVSAEQSVLLSPEAAEAWLRLWNGQ